MRRIIGNGARPARGLTDAAGVNRNFFIDRENRPVLFADSVSLIR